MDFNKKIFLLFLIFLYINCQTFICSSEDSSGLKVGDTVYLCIHNIQNETRIAIPIEVDEYSVATIKGLYNKITNIEDTLELLAQVGTLTSVYKAVSNYVILNID